MKLVSGVGELSRLDRWGNPVRRDTFSHIHYGSPTRGDMAQIVSGARHFVQYVTCLAVSRETSVLKGTAVTTPHKRSVKLSRGGGLSRVPETI